MFRKFALLAAMWWISPLSYGDCSRWMSYHDAKKEEAEAAAIAGMVAGGAVSFFTLGLGTLAVTAAGAGAAKLLDDQAEEYKRKYEQCLRDEQEAAQRREQREAERRKERGSKDQGKFRGVDL